MSQSIATVKRLDRIQRVREDLNLPELLTELDGELVPNGHGRDFAMSMTITGATVSDIAKVFGLTPGWVKKNFKYEIESGLNIANARVAKALFETAMDGDVGAQKFWLKSRANWRETRDEIDNPIVRIQPVLNISIVSEKAELPMVVKTVDRNRLEEI